MKIIYAPSYCLLKSDPSQLTDMSLQTIKKAIEMVLNDAGNPILILSTSRPFLWEKEAKIKKKMVLEAGLDLKDVIIIPAMVDSYDEAEKIKKIISNYFDGCHRVILTVVAEKWHAPRVALSLRMVLPSWVDIEIVKVSAKIERHLDTSRLRSWLCSSTKLNYVLWQWFFGLIGPLMMRRQIRRMRKK